MQNNLEKAYEQLSEIRNPSMMEISMTNMIKNLMEHDLKAHADVENMSIFVPYASGYLNIVIECSFREESDSVLVQAVLPIDCCKKNRREMERLLHFINYGTIMMPFEYDPRDGECRIKRAHYCGDIPLSEKQADHMIWFIIAMLHKYRDTLVPLAMGMEPDYKKTCSEYNELKLQEMDINSEDNGETADSEDSASEDDEDESEDDEIFVDDDFAEESEDSEAEGSEEGPEEDGDEEDSVYGMLTRLMNEALRRQADEAADDEDAAQNAENPTADEDAQDEEIEE